MNKFEKVFKQKEKNKTASMVAREISKKTRDPYRNIQNYLNRYLRKAPEKPVKWVIIFADYWKVDMEKLIERKK